MLVPYYEVPFNRASLPNAFNWELIAALLPIQNLHEQEFYLRAAMAENWTPLQLKQHIEQNTYQNTKLFKTLRARIARYVLSSGKQKTQLERQLKISPLLDDYLKRQYNNPFVEPSLSVYQNLLQPQPHEPAYSYRQLQDSYKKSDEDAVIAHIVGFRRDMFLLLNAMWNETYRIVGDTLNFENKYHPDLLAALIKKIKARYGNIFSDDDLQKATQLNSQPENFDAILHIIRLITWPHIKLLITLQNIDEKLFYAELAHQQDLSVQELSEQMSINSYAEVNKKREQDSVPEKYVGVEPEKIIEQRYHQETTTHGSKTVTVRTIYINEDAMKPTHENLNILQNQSFMQFMAVTIC